MLRPDLEQNRAKLGVTAACCDGRNLSQRLGLLTHQRPAADKAGPMSESLKRGDVSPWEWVKSQDFVVQLILHFPVVSLLPFTKFNSIPSEMIQEMLTVIKEHPHLGLTSTVTSA